MNPWNQSLYLCSTALLRRSFSLFSTAASGLTWEIFSSSVPLMLDAWLAEGVSRPDSCWRRQGGQRFCGSSPVSRDSWMHFWVCPWLLFVKQHRHPEHVSDDSERVKGNCCQCLSCHMAQQVGVSQNWMWLLPSGAGAGREHNSRALADLQSRLVIYTIINLRSSTQITHTHTQGRRAARFTWEWLLNVSTFSWDLSFASLAASFTSWNFSAN